MFYKNNLKTLNNPTNPNTPLAPTKPPSNKTANNNLTNFSASPFSKTATKSPTTMATPMKGSSKTR